MITTYVSKIPAAWSLAGLSYLTYIGNKNKTKEANMQIPDHNMEREISLIEWIQANPEIYELFSPEVMDYDAEDFLRIATGLVNEGFYGLLYILLKNGADFMDEVKEANKVFFMDKVLELVKADLPKNGAEYIAELKRQRDLSEGRHNPRVRKTYATVGLEM